jgi:hypothetical protein
MINTLKLAQRLQERGVDRGQAEAIADEIDVALQEQGVSKNDLALTEERLKTAIANSRNQMVLWVAALIGGLGAWQHFWH